MTNREIVAVTNVLSLVLRVEKIEDTQEHWLDKALALLS